MILKINTILKENKILKQYTILNEPIYIKYNIILYMYI